jgi:hypothetical protein
MTRVVIRHHGVDYDAPVVKRTQLRHRRALDLTPRRHQRGAVLECPAIILHVRNLDAART